MDGAFGVLALRFEDAGVDAQPIADAGDFSERHGGLHHAEGSGIHAEEERSFLSVGVAG